MSGTHRRGAACTIVLAALLACVVLPARAAIVQEAQSAAFANGAALTFPHPIGIGIDRALVVGVSTYNANKTVASLTYGGTPLTRVGFRDGGSGSDDRRMELWMLVDPPIGTADVAITMSGGAKVVAGAASFFGVDALTPTGGFLSAEGNGSLASIVVPSVAGALVMDVLSVAGDAATAGVGAGQSQMWNLWSQSNPGSVVGAASIEPGAAAVTMSWNLASTTYWVIGAVSLRPAPSPPFLVDGMIKLQGEPVTAFAYDSWYENPASLQVRSANVLASVPAAYTLRFDNDGGNPDVLVITGPGSSPAFAVEYRDAGNVDRTAAVAAGGYALPLASGASTTWTLLVTPVLGGAIGGDVFTAAVTATSAGDALAIDQVRAVTTCVSPSLSMTKSADLANALPGQDINYTVVASTAGGLSDATGIVLVDSIPDYAGFRVGSVTFNAGTTTLTSIVSYSSDDGTTWSYVPASGSCTAPAGYDYCVTHVRWSLVGIMPPSLSFQIGMAVRVK
ncbi:MAG TPA: hypothetical protein VFT13_08910 [Candidatus Krumholzibacteria bacterium]|nr:hypothetical protein [Candidatus Krumholzibacteria bacterium]